MSFAGAFRACSLTCAMAHEWSTEKGSPGITPDWADGVAAERRSGQNARASRVGANIRQGGRSATRHVTGRDFKMLAVDGLTKGALPPRRFAREAKGPCASSSWLRPHSRRRLSMGQCKTEGPSTGPSRLWYVGGVQGSQIDIEIEVARPPVALRGKPRGRAPRHPGLAAPGDALSMGSRLTTPKSSTCSIKAGCSERDRPDRPTAQTSGAREATLLRSRHGAGGRGRA
jgi:hypothetical protein